MTEIKKQIEQNKKLQVRKIFNIKNLNRIICAAVVFMGVYYMTNVNDLIVKGFILQEMRGQLSALSESNKELEYQKLSRESFGSVSQRVQGLKMVAANNIDYLEIKNGMVAKK